jgi:hypothetical protein
MAGCNTGRNIQKYKGAGASTLQDALENSNVATLDINLISGAVYIGDGGGLSNINASAVAGNLQAVTDNSATTTNKITLTNGVTSLETTGNVLITGNVTAGNFLGDGGTLSNIAASKDFQEVTDLGATSSNKITLTNSVTSLETSGNIELGHASDTTIARSGPGKVTIEGDEIRTGTVPISKGGTGTTSASAAATALGLGTGDSPRFTAIELGNASDTTLARSGPGKITIEGQEIRTGTVPISKGGTGTTSASAAATALGLGTGNSPQFTAIELGNASDTTLARSGPGKITIEGQEIRTGTVPVSKGGTGTTSLNNLITMGTHTTGDFVGTITGGNGITSSGGTTGEDTDHTLSIDTKTNGGLVFENNKLAVNLGASAITGTLAVSDGGTGTTSLNNLITMGTHTTGNFVQTITGGDGITSTGATSGENVAHSLSVDTKANGGLVFENNKLAVNLGASAITGTLAVSDGGTGTTSLNNLITMGTHTTGNFVQTITGGDGITSTGATSGENVAHSLSVDTKANGGLVFENNKLAVKLDAGSITGKLAVSDGGTGHDTYTTGQLLVANGTSSLTKLTPGTSGHFLKSQGAGSALVWASVADIGSATPGELIMGDYLTGGPHTGEDDTTIHVDGTPVNTANTVVVRSLTGDIAVSGLTATTIQLGHASDTTLARDSAGVVSIEGHEIRTGTVQIANGGTGTTSLNNLITLGAHTNGNYVASITGGSGITAGAAAEGGTPSVSVDLKSSGGLVFESNKLAVKLDDGSITGKLAVIDGGTGANTLDNLITLGTHTNGNYVASITGGNGITAGAAAEGGTPSVSVDLKSSGGLEFNGGQMRVKIDDSDINGVLPIAKGGTGISGGYSAGDILYGTSSTTTLSKLSPVTGDVGSFLKLGNGNVPEWATVSSSGGSYWTEHTNGNDVYYNTGNVGISNAAPTHTLDIGSNVSVIDDGVDKLYIRGNVYSTNDIIALGTVHCKEIVAVNSRIKNSTVVTEAPTRQIRLI